MKKFEGLLLCTDLDDTLLTSDKRVSEKNLAAIEYFKSEGGLFTFVTGRVPLGALPILDYVMPNAPAVCFNGGGIYDFEKRKTLWALSLDSAAYKVTEFVDSAFPSAGIEVCTADTVYFPKPTALTEQHKILERFPDNYDGCREIKEPWSKVIFMVEAEEMNALKQTIAASPFADKYTFVRTSPWYYELLPKGVNKGDGMLKLADLMGIERNKVAAVGDNENDVDMITAAGMGIAVKNAVDSVKSAADYITADNNSDAIADVIENLADGSI